MTNLRTKKTQKEYENYKANGFLNNGCNLCKESSIKDFKYWRILTNRFPHDGIAKINHMIIPKRHIAYKKLNATEKKEFEKIKLNYIEEKYDIILEAMDRRKSIPQHHHIHLIVLKD